MTEGEARAKGDEKAQKIRDFAKSLNVRIIAEQAITAGNIIRPVVYFYDEERYDIDPKVIRTPADAVIERHHGLPRGFKAAETKADEIQTPPSQQ